MCEYDLKTLEKSVCWTGSCQRPKVEVQESNEGSQKAQTSVINNSRGWNVQHGSDS